jgi:excisionase family DNA binding protein
MARSGRAAIGWSVPNAQDRGELTYGFFLKITLSPYGRFQSDESSDQEIKLPEPIGTIRYRGSPAGTSFTDASIMLFSGSGYQTRVEAETAGRALKNVVQLASIDAGIAIDAGRDDVLGGPGQVVVDAAAEQGVLLLPDVHGLQVFEETGRPASLSITAHGVVTSPLRSFISALLIRSYHTKELDAKHSLASQLYGISRFETSQRSRLLTLVTALDVLSEKNLRGGISQEVASEILDITKERLTQAKSSEHDEEELKQLESLVSIVGSLKYQSIAASIKELAKDIDQDVLSTELSADEIVGLAYKARNDIIHGGQTSVDLTLLLVPLERLTAELSAGAIISVKDSASILNCSESTIRRYIRNGRIKANKSEGRWRIRPEELKLFMTSRPDQQESRNQR